MKNAILVLIRPNPDTYDIACLYYDIFVVQGDHG